MAIKLILDSLDELPQVTADDYVERDGRYFLKEVTQRFESEDGTEGILAVSDIGKLKRVAEEAKGHRSKAAKAREEALAQLQAWAELGESPDAVREMLEKSKAGGAAKGKLDDDELRSRVESVTKQLTAKHEKEKAELSGKLTKGMSALRKALVDNAAILAMNGKETKALSPDLLLPHIRDLVDVIESEDEKLGFVAKVRGEDGHHRIRSDGSDMTIADLVREMRDDARYAPAFAANATPGTGVTPGSRNGSATGQGSFDTIKDLPPAQMLARAREIQKQSR